MLSEISRTEKDKNTVQFHLYVDSKNQELKKQNTETDS